MALNTIFLEFDECEPAPASGYKISYRPQGSEIDYRTVNVPNSPALIEDANDPAGTSYEGVIQGNCGDGVLGVPIPFLAPNSDGPGASVSGSAPGESGSDGGGPPAPTYNYECEVYSCENCSEPAGTIVAASTNPFLTLFKYYKAQFGGDVVYRPISTSAGVAADNIIGFAFDTCVLACAAPPPEES